MKGKTIWIMNHYATNMFFNRGGRHYWFARNLDSNGYEPVIFCANVAHETNRVVDIKKGNHVVEQVDTCLLYTSASHGDFANRAVGIPNHYLLQSEGLCDCLGIEFEAYDSKLMAPVIARLSDGLYPMW